MDAARIHRDASNSSFNDDGDATGAKPPCQDSDVIHRTSCA